MTRTIWFNLEESNGLWCEIVRCMEFLFYGRYVTWLLFEDFETGGRFSPKMNPCPCTSLFWRPTISYGKLWQNQHSLANWPILKGWLPSSLTLITQRIGMTWTNILREFSPLSQPWYQLSQCCSASFIVTSSYTCFLYLLKCHSPWETSINLSFSFQFSSHFPSLVTKIFKLFYLFLNKYYLFA